VKPSTKKPRSRARERLVRPKKRNGSNATKTTAQRMCVQVSAAWETNHASRLASCAGALVDGGSSNAAARRNTAATAMTMHAQNAILSHKGKPGARIALLLGSALTVVERCRRAVLGPISINSSLR
jgi:hypothetical protein